MTINIPLARRDLIASRLIAGSPVNSGTLAAEFGVSEDAIRRDLRALAAAGVCRRVYGGALPLTPGTSPVSDRAGVDIDRKRALARAAMTLVEPGSFIFLDNGSTSLVIAEELPSDSDLVVATSSIEIAAALAARRDIHIHMVGGDVDNVIGGSIDGIALEAVGRLNIDLCFLGVCTLSAEGGVSAFDGADATFKRALIARSRRTLVLAANEKIGAQAPHRVTTLDTVLRVIVEHDAADIAVEDLRSAGARILRAEPLALPQS
ncbi:DeoR/GlpR family DNA-binding transcription regulator [Novosphingobium sp. BL-8H]|uniref:DeoR/GlpR family DNA-binding transcription regulator n=1 Tax=Novosphingobium sp. BL-8H TaxID=3127640 RepID=UPI0037563E7C